MDQTQYLDQFPSPPRRGEPLEDEEAEVAGFHFANRERYSNDVTLTRKVLVRHMTTQSNIIVAVEGNRRPLDDVRGWLYSSLDRFFVEREATFEFGGSIWYPQKSRVAASGRARGGRPVWSTT